MLSHELEDMTLLLVRDAAEPPMWIDRWAVSYPIVQTAEVARNGGIAHWQQQLAETWSQIRSDSVAVVAHGAGVSAWLAWFYQADMVSRRRVNNVILVSPFEQAFPDDAEHTFQRVRINCRAALVLGEHDNGCSENWARQRAMLWQARLLICPHPGRLSGSLQGWQWGMKLMQEMLLS